VILYDKFYVFAAGTDFSEFHIPSAHKSQMYGAFSTTVV